MRRARLEAACAYLRRSPSVRTDPKFRFRRRRKIEIPLDFADVSSMGARAHGRREGAAALTGLSAGHRVVGGQAVGLVPHKDPAMNDQAPELSASSSGPDNTRPRLPPNVPLFTILTLVAAFQCMFTPRFAIILPVTIAMGCGATAYIKRERWWVAALIAAAFALGMLLLASYQMSHH